MIDKARGLFKREIKERFPGKDLTKITQAEICAACNEIYAEENSEQN